MADRLCEDEFLVLMSAAAPTAVDKNSRRDNLEKALINCFDAHSSVRQ